MATTVTIPNPGPFEESLKNVRADSSDVNWTVAGHVDGDPNLIEYRASGTGGLDQMQQSLDDGEVMYALVRLTEKFDLSTNVKFVYIHWIGSNVPFVKKGKYGVVHGSVIDKFGPSHCNVETSSLSDLTEEVIMTKINETSGTKSKVMEKSEAASRKDRGFTSSSNIVKTGKQMAGVGAPGAVDIKVDDSVRQAISDVRSDASSTNWCLAEYEGNNPKSSIILREKGSEVDDGLFSSLEEDKAAYGLLRMTDEVDGISTVKFVFITWVGERTKPMAKAKISTHKASTEKLFAPAHVIMYATAKDDVKLEVIKDKIASASGSKSHVK